MTGLAGEQLALVGAFTGAVALGQAAATKATDHHPAREHADAGGLVIGVHGEVCAAHADGCHGGVETEALARILDCTTRDAARHTLAEFKLELAVGRVGGVHLVGNNLRGASRAEDQKTTVGGLDVQVAGLASGQGLPGLDNVAQVGWLPGDAGVAHRLHHGTHSLRASSAPPAQHEGHADK